MHLPLVRRRRRRRAPGPGSDRQGLVSFAVGADGSGNDLLMREMGGTRMPFSRDPGNEDGTS